MKWAATREFRADECRGQAYFGRIILAAVCRRDHREQWRKLNGQGVIAVTQASNNSGLNQTDSNEN